MYALAFERVCHNCGLLRPALTFREFTEQAWLIPARFVEQHHRCVAHGLGLGDEWPAIGCDARDPTLQDGIVVPGMVLCVESYPGEVGGTEGVKLEARVLITARGREVLSRFPIESLVAG